MRHVGLELSTKDHGRSWGCRRVITGDKSWGQFGEEVLGVTSTQRNPACDSKAEGLQECYVTGKECDGT